MINRHTCFNAEIIMLIKCSCNCTTSTCALLGEGKQGQEMAVYVCKYV